MTPTLTAKADAMCEKADKARAQHRASSGLSRVAKQLRNIALVYDLRSQRIHVSRKHEQSLRRQ